MREMSVTEQKVQSGPDGNRGRSDGDRGGWGLGCPSANAAPFWLARYEGDGLEGLSNRSHRPAHCPIKPRLRSKPWCSRCGEHMSPDSCRDRSAPRHLGIQNAEWQGLDSSLRTIVTQGAFGSRYGKLTELKWAVASVTRTTNRRGAARMRCPLWCRPGGYDAAIAPIQVPQFRPNTGGVLT